MKIFIENQRISDECASESKLVQKYGKTNGARLNRRLCTLAASKSVNDISRELPDAMSVCSTDSGLKFCVGCQTYGFVHFRAIDDNFTLDQLAEVTEIVITEIERGE